MGEYILQFIEFVTENYYRIESSILYIVVGLFIVYGVFLAVDAWRRYDNKFSVLIVLALWFTLSLLFLPIYFIIRPDKSNGERKLERAQLNLLLVGNGLSFCEDCGVAVKNSSKYCYQCGAYMHKECPECGNIVHKNWEFCHICGFHFTLPKISLIDRFFKFTRLDDLFMPRKVKVNSSIAKSKDTEIPLQQNQTVILNAESISK